MNHSATARRSSGSVDRVTTGGHVNLRSACLEVSSVVCTWHCICWYLGYRKLAWTLMRDLLRRRILLNSHADSLFRSLRVTCRVTDSITPPPVDPRALRRGVLVDRFGHCTCEVRLSHQTSPCAWSLCLLVLQRPRSAGRAEQAKSTSSGPTKDATSCEGEVGGGVHWRQSCVGSAA